MYNIMIINKNNQVSITQRWMVFHINFDMGS